MNKMNWITRTALAGALLATAPTALQAAAQERTVQFSIPAQPLGDALRAYALATGEQIIFSGDLVAGRQAPALEGAFSGDAGLERLLAGSGLVARRTERGSIMIMRADDPRATAPILTPSRAAAADERADGDRVVVTGTNIRGVYPDSSPVQVFTSDDIARTGAGSVEEFMRKLPENLGTRVALASGSANIGSNAARNREGVNAVDIRGLGIGTTLVLINGRRPAFSSFGMGVDISMIPLAAVERVEVLTDGASAIYGSDAVGGVVNFVLRDDLEGAETSVSYGGVWRGDLREGMVSQLLGTQWSGGRASAGATFSSSAALNTLERDYATPAGEGFLSPVDQRYGLFASFGQDLGSRTHIQGDFLFTHRNVKNETSDLRAPTVPILFLSKTKTDQFFGTLNADFELGEQWVASVTGSYSEVDASSRLITRLPASANPTPWDQFHRALDLTAKLDGVLGVLPAGDVRFSVGLGELDERYSAARTSNGIATTNALGRRTKYAFGETLIPIVGPAQSFPFARRLELSLAARYTEYEDTSSPPLGSDFGSRVSPKVGVLWELTPGLSLRSTYGQSFRAPHMTEVDPSGATSVLNAPRLVSGVMTQLFTIQGPAPNLVPETSDAYTVGLDWRPDARDSFNFTATYFNIDYQDRITETGQFNTPALANPAAWPEKVYAPTSIDHLEALLRAHRNITNTTGISLADPRAAATALFNLPSILILDSRVMNLALSKMDGVDVGMSDRFDLDWGTVSAGVRATQILSFREQITASAPITTVVDTLLRPASLKGRAHAGITQGPLESVFAINYVDDYTNPWAAGGPQHIESWTTIDWVTSYTFEAGESDILGGTRIALSVQNLLDRDPPFVRAASGAQGLTLPVGFDTANANPFGRIVTVRLSKRW